MLSSFCSDTLGYQVASLASLTETDVELVWSHVRGEWEGAA